MPGKISGSESGSELRNLFIVFVPEDWSAFSAGLVEIGCRYCGLRCRAAVDLFWLEVEELVRDLASQRLEKRGAQLIELTVAAVHPSPERADA